MQATRENFIILSESSSNWIAKQNLFNIAKNRGEHICIDMYSIKAKVKGVIKSGSYECITPHLILQSQLRFVEIGIEH